MRHMWGLPDKEGRPDDSVLDNVPLECWVHVSYCLSCKQIFCEHCLGPDMYNVLECHGEASKVAE